MQCTVVYQCSVSVSNSRSPVKGEACVADARQVRTGMPTRFSLFCIYGQRWVCSNSAFSTVRYPSCVWRVDCGLCFKIRWLKLTTTVTPDSRAEWAAGLVGVALSSGFSS